MKQVNKRKARKLFDDGIMIYLLPSNYRKDIETILRFGCPVKLNENNCDDSFDKIVNSFEYYNCFNNETGRYTHFFIF